MKTIIDTLTMDLAISEHSNEVCAVDVKLVPKNFKIKTARIHNCGLCKKEDLTKCIGDTILETVNIVLKYLELDKNKLSKERELFLNSGLYLPEYDKENNAWFYIDNLGIKQYE